jgi:hypothetical protein
MEIELLQEEITRGFPEWKLSNLRLLATGLEAEVFLAETALFGSVSVKVPLVRFIDNANDQGLDARDLLKQDAASFLHLRKHGMPAPECLAVHFGKTLDFLAYRYIETDAYPCTAEMLGGFLRRLHELPLPNFIPVAHRSQERVEHVLATLTLERLKSCQSLIDTKLPIVGFGRLRAAFLELRKQHAFLHMDCREPNLLCLNGMIVSVIDWSNALLAHPVIEIARVVEYGWSYDEVIRGYGCNPFLTVSATALNAAKLYSTSMLALVFLSEAPDVQKGKKAVQRLKEVLDNFASAS